MDSNRPGGRPDRQSHHAQYRVQGQAISTIAPNESDPPELAEVDQYGVPPRTTWVADPFLRESGHHALGPVPQPLTNFVETGYVGQVSAGSGAPSQYESSSVQTPAVQHVPEIQQTFPQHPSMVYAPVQTGELAYVGSEAYAPLSDPGLFPVGSNEFALYQTYEEQLRRANTSIVQGELLTASQHVLEASEYLLRNVAVLGLTYDNPATYEQRLKLFRDFNRCWLALAQKQIDQLNALIDAGQTILPSNVLDDDTIQHMGNMLIQLCDPIAKDGLVDYEMGVEEERILDTLVICRDLIKSVQDPTHVHESAGRPDSWSSASSRGSRSSRR